jgi:hypothetical protein
VWVDLTLELFIFTHIKNIKIPNWYERLVISQIDKGYDLSILEKKKYLKVWKQLTMEYNIKKSMQ